MGNGAGPTDDHIHLVRGPVNTALYDLRNGEVYSVNPLTAEVLEGGRACSELSESNEAPQARKLLYTSIETLQVLRGYLARHPALAQYAVTGSKGFLGGVVSSPLSCQKVVVAYCNTPLPRLNFMWLELTQDCNLSCAHCYAEAGVDNPNGLSMLSMGHWKEILEEGARLGAKGVQFTGGEPTLYPGLMDLIGHARSCQYEYIEVFTNATRLGDRLLREWASSGVRAAVSFYSYDPATHDGITGRPGSFHQTVRGIKALLSHQIPVSVAIVLMRENLSQLRGTVEFLKGLGLRDGEIGHDFVRPTGRGVAEAVLLDEDAVAVGAGFKPAPTTEGGQGTCGVKFAQGTCWKGAIAITCRGEVYPCIFARQLPVGRLPEMGLEEVVKGQALQRLWQITLGEVETCKDCELRYGCFDCRALAQTVTGDLLSKNPRCQYNPYTGLMGGNGGKRMKERPKRRIDLINEDVEDESVIYDPKNHNVHHLNPMASIIWELCDGNHTPQEISEEIVDVLEGDPAQVEGDVTKTLGEFQEKGLLEGV